MATSGSFNTTSREGRYLTFSWSVKSQDTANNKTTISWTLKGGGTSGYVYCGDFEVTIDGTIVYSNDTRREVYNTTTIASGTRTITHSADGTKTLTASVKASIYTYTQDRTGSGSWALPTIARTPTVTVSNTAKTETSITMKWSSNLTCNRVRYRTSTNSGSSWSSWTSKTVSAKSGSYTVSGLTANTSYTIQTELRSSESSLTNTANKTVKTYNWPYATASNFTVKTDMAWVEVTNPLGRSGTLEILAEGVVIHSEEGALESGGYSGLDEEFLTQIPNSMTGQWAVRITYGEHVSTSATATYSAAGFNPSFSGTPTYADANTTAQAIIQNDHTILQNIGTPRFTASGTAQYTATIASGKVTILGNETTLTRSGNNVVGTTGVIDSATNVTATVTIIDSRGNSASQNVTVTMAEYTLPSAIIALARQNNYYSETNITVNASVMDFTGNVATITARWKETGTSTWSSPQTIQDNTLTALNGNDGLDNTKAWDVQVIITDSFGGTTTYNLYVGIGLPIFYIDRMLRAIGINSFPEAGVPLMVEDVDILGELFYKPGDTITVEANGVGGAPLSGYVTSSTTNIRILVPVGRSLANINTITCNACKGQIRGARGYVNGSSSSVDWATATTITCVKATEYAIQIQFHASSAYTNVTNNTPVVLAATELELEFN